MIFLAPVGNLPYIDVVEIFHKQAEGQKVGGVDVLWLETISSTEEFIAAAENFYRADMAWCKTLPKSLHKIRIALETRQPHPKPSLN